MRYYLNLVFIFLSLEASSQVNTFYRKYNLPGMQGGLGIVNMTDGGFVGTGQHEGNGSAGDCDVYVYRVDPCGNLLWMKLLGTSHQEGGKSINIRSNGNLLVVGLYDGKGMIIELDPNGNLVWEKRYDHTIWTISIAECSNSDLIVTAMNGVNNYSLFRCDATGNVIWSKSISGMGEIPTSVISLANGNFIVNCTYNIPGKDFSLMLFDPTGNVLWSKVYGGTGFTDTDFHSWGSKAIYDSSDNSIVVICQTVTGGNDNIVFAKINAINGNVIWAEIIGDGGSEQARDVVKTNEGYAIVGNSNGYSATAAANPNLTEDMMERDILLCDFDSTGILRWARTYGGSERDKGIGLRHNADNTFLISAYTSSPVFGNTDAAMDPLFIKTDTLGMVGCQFFSPSVTVLSTILTEVVSGTVSNSSISAIAVNSIISDFVPSDNYQCLQCATEPLFRASDTIVCVNEPVYFYNTTVIGLMCFQQWSVDGHLIDGSTDTIPYVFSLPGNYIVLLYSNCGASTDTFRVNIKVNPFPDAAFNVIDNCIHDTTHFVNTTIISSGTIKDWLWDMGDGKSSSLKNPIHIYDTAGNYLVHLSAISDEGCIDSTVNMIDIHPLPHSDFNTMNVCLTDSAGFSNLSTGPFPITNYNWLFGDGSTSSSEITSHLFSQPGNYNVELKVEDIHGCKDKHTSVVSIYEMPVARYSYEPLNCKGIPEIRLINESEKGIQWFWNFYDGTVSNDKNPSHLYKATGSYMLSLLATSEKGCSDSVSGELTINAEYFFWIPNTFTPNGDGINDVFIPVFGNISEYEMTIFDRWGNAVYKTSNPGKGWDGNVNNLKSQTGIYVYKILFKDLCGDTDERLGHVCLLY